MNEEQLNIQTVPAGRGAAWLGQGFELFKQAPGVWIGIIVVLFLLQALMGVIPLGGLVSALIGPVFGAGVLFGCRDLEAGQDLKFMYLFEGFRSDRMGALILLGLAMLILSLLLALLLGGALFSMMGTAPMQSGHMGMNHVGSGPGLFLVLISVLLIAPVLMAVWFSTQLVALAEMDVIPALKTSMRGCTRNIGALTLYGLLLIPLFIVAMVPMGLGLLVLVPTMMAANYRSYVEIYGAPDEMGGGPPPQQQSLID